MLQQRKCECKMVVYKYLVNINSMVTILIKILLETFWRSTNHFNLSIFLTNYFLSKWAYIRDVHWVTYLEAYIRWGRLIYGECINGILRYLKKNVSDEVDFFCMQISFLKTDTMIFDKDDQAFSKFQNCKFAMSLQYLKEEVRDEKKLIFACR